MLTILIPILFHSVSELEAALSKRNYKPKKLVFQVSISLCVSLYMYVYKNENAMIFIVCSWSICLFLGHLWACSLPCGMSKSMCTVTTSQPSHCYQHPSVNAFTTSTIHQTLWYVCMCMFIFQYSLAI